MDVSRPHENPVGRKELYSVTNEANAGFKTKVEKQGLEIWKDAKTIGFEVVGVRV